MRTLTPGYKDKRTPLGISDSRTELAISGPLGGFKFYPGAMTPSKREADFYNFAENVQQYYYRLKIYKLYAISILTLIYSPLPQLKPLFITTVERNRENKS